MKTAHIINEATLVYSETHNGNIKYGLAYCSPKDQFSRKEGRKRATERLLGEDKGYHGKIPGTQDAVGRCLADALAKAKHPDGRSTFLRYIIGL